MLSFNADPISIIIVDQIYSWSNYTPPSTVKVVILGQGTQQ
jgi:uracil DNA glycosylase